VPLYPYACEKCQHGFEVMKRMSEAARAEACPECRGPGVRLFGVAYIQTSNTFLAKDAQGGSQFSDKTRQHMLDMARRAGVSTDGKAYMPEIARFPGDPEAWVQSTDEIKSVIERRGWAAEGDINVKAEAKAPKPDVPLAPDLVAEKVETILEDRLGPDFTTASGPIVERAVDDVMNQYAQPAHLLKDQS
jgi:putative FmdB family regulatory protein